MRPAIALSLFGLSILCSGCALIEDANRNLCVGITTPIEAHREIARNKKWAETAWQQIDLERQPGCFSSDHAQGFKDGYAEYLFRGGDGEPPLMAPLRYRHLGYQTPQGYLAIADWFAGYRHGAGVARDSGARRWITGPTGLSFQGPAPTAPEPQFPANGEPIPLPAPREAADPETLPVLPLPRETMGVVPAPAVGDPKARLMGIRMPPPAFPEPTADSEPVKVKIKGIHVPPPPVSVTEQTLAPEPVRVRITTITVQPRKD